MSVIPYLEKLELFAHENFPREMERSRLDYLERLGVVHKSEEYYDENMKAFLDSFVFQNPVSDNQITPLEAFIERMNSTMPPEDLQVYVGFRESKHSLFFIKGVTADGVDCRDLFQKSKIIVPEEVSAGFLKGEIFESRIFPFQDSFRFGEMFRFHPKRANRIIKKAAKSVRGKGQEEAQAIMLKLAGCKIKHQMYPRIDLLEFYKEILVA
jgi:hypothetical protein